MPRLHVVILLSQLALSGGCSNNLLQASGSGGSGGDQTATGGQAGGVGGGPGGVGGGAGFPVSNPAGHSGTGGVAGSGGMGGAAGGLPVCAQEIGGGGGAAASPVTVESCAYDAAAKPVLTSVSAAVTVVSVDSVPDGNCPFFFFPFLKPSSTPSAKLVVESADQTRWTLYLRIPNLPPDTIRMGDTFDLAIRAQVAFWQGDEQLITIAKNGKLIAFGYSGFDAYFLDGFGITIRDAGPVCSVVGCGFEHHAVHVVNGSDAADVREGETRRIGNLSLTVSQDVIWQTTGGCDASNHVLLGGFVAAPQ